MSVLLLGVSHRTAPVEVLERVTVAEPDRPKMLTALLESDHVSEAMVLSTCNRVEIYAVVDSFHAALADVGSVLADHGSMPFAELTEHAYVRYSESAVEHMFTVAAGLDSMVVGEQQILGQLRSAYAVADEQHAVGRVLHELSQDALRVGKRVHSDTRIDSAGASMVSVSLDRADGILGGLAGRRAVVVGAGAMGSLAVAYLIRAGIEAITLVNRTIDRARNLARTATEAGVSARAEGLDGLVAAVAQADVLVACTGAVGTVLSVDQVRSAVAGRSDRPIVLCDMGLPRDIDPAVADLPGVGVIDVQTLQRDPAATLAAEDERAGRDIVASALASYLLAQREAAVTPTVAALRRRAAEVVESELLRLDGRLPDLPDQQRDEVATTVRRVVDKLLHAPTVRVKQLAGAPGGGSYAEALRELFELSPGSAAAVVAASESSIESAGPALDPSSRDHQVLDHSTLDHQALDQHGGTDVTA